MTSVASPHIDSSPTRNTFPDSKAISRALSPATNGGRPASSRARQNSTQSTADVARQGQISLSTNKQNGAGTPDIVAAATVTGRSIPEVKALMKEAGTNSKGEHMPEDVDSQEPEAVGAIVVGKRRDSTMKREDPETNGEAMQSIQTTTVTLTKSGRASKPSTPALSQFPEPRARRNALEVASANKRSHKKGAGVAAQLLAQQQNSEVEDGLSSLQGDDDDGEMDDADADEPRYCYCNGVSYGEMVGCDADGCEREWFHLECVGLKVAPRGNCE